MAGDGRERCGPGAAQADLGLSIWHGDRRLAIEGNPNLDAEVTGEPENRRRWTAIPAEPRERLRKHQIRTSPCAFRLQQSPRNPLFAGRPAIAHPIIGGGGQWAL